MRDKLLIWEILRKIYRGLGVGWPAIIGLLECPEWKGNQILLLSKNKPRRQRNF